MHIQPVYIILALCLSLAGLACKSSKSSTGDLEEVSWQTLEEGAYCGIDETVNRLICSQEDWLTFYKQFGANRFPAPEAPEIDFSGQCVLACVMGSRNSGGYRVQIQSMSKAGETLKVQLLYIAPGPQCMVTEALTQPYIFATLSSKNVSTAEFEVADRTDHCNQ